MEITFDSLPESFQSALLTAPANEKEFIAWASLYQANISSEMVLNDEETEFSLEFDFTFTGPIGVVLSLIDAMVNPDILLAELAETMPEMDDAQFVEQMKLAVGTYTVQPGENSFLKVEMHAPRIVIDFFTKCEQPDLQEEYEMIVEPSMSSLCKIVNQARLNAPIGTDLPN